MFQFVFIVFWSAPVRDGWISTLALLSAAASDFEFVVSWSAGTRDGTISMLAFLMVALCAAHVETLKKSNGFPRVIGYDTHCTVSVVTQ